jgi:nucleotide-binding universal stress UspA family protein
LDEEQIDSSLSSILGSNPSRALVDTAKNENFDLIVVGSRGLGSAAAFLLGSVSKQVISKASCDVLVVKK